MAEPKRILSDLQETLDAYEGRLPRDVHAIVRDRLRGAGTIKAQVEASRGASNSPPPRQE